MFCPGRQIDAGCFVWGVKKWHGMFCPGMFCPTFEMLYAFSHVDIWINVHKSTYIMYMGDVF